MRRGLAFAAALALLLPLAAGCGGGRPTAERSDGVPATKICGLFDRDRIVALGLPVDDIVPRGRVADRDTRLEHPLRCTVSDARTHRAVLRVAAAEVDPSEEDDATAVLDDDYAVRRNDPPAGTVCSRPDALNSVGTGYACRSDELVHVVALVPGRLVRLTYRPLRTEPPATAYARAIGLIANLQENVVAYDQAHPSLTPSPSS